MKIEKIKELATEGFTIKDLKAYLNQHFPDSFGFAVYRLAEGSRIAEFKRQEGAPFSGLSDADLREKIYFPQVKRDHMEAFRIDQGDENTYFDFALESEKGDEFIGTFGFKDRGDVPHEYITKFIVFLQAAYGQPFTIEHSVMAKGGKAAEKKSVKLTPAEDAAWDKWMAYFLTEGKTEKKAEEETIKILKDTFPRLRKLLTGEYKISLELEEVHAEGGPVKVLEGIVTYKRPGGYSEATIKVDDNPELLFVRWGDIQPFWEGDKITYEVVSEDGYHEPTGEITSQGGSVHFGHKGKVIKVLSINRAISLSMVRLL